MEYCNLKQKANHNGHEGLSQSTQIVTSTK